MSMKLYVVGFGSGSFGSMTKECVEAIEKSKPGKNHEDY